MITFTIGGEKHVLPIDSSKTLRVGSVSPSVALEVEEMTDTTEQKALALINAEIDRDPTGNNSPTYEALCRAIEQHETDIADLQAEYDEVCKLFEAFRQEVSDAVESRWMNILAMKCEDVFSRFIVVKPDPLVEAWDEAWGELSDKAAKLKTFRAALAARGLEVRKIGEGE